MGFIVFLVATFFCGSLMRDAGSGLVAGVLSFLLYRQNIRITALEKQRVPLKEPQHSPVLQVSAVLPPTPVEPTPPPKPLFQSIPTPVQAVPDEETPKAAPQRAEASNAFSQTPPIQVVPALGSQESLEALLGSSVAKFLTQGNPIARIGAVILLLGVGFALKLAADEGLFSPELRLIAAALLSIALLIFGWRLRDKRGQFAVTLQGTGLGIFYITTFIAFKMYEFIPASLAFLFFLVVTVLSGILAVVGNARSIAVLAIIGGFLAPILSSSGGGNHIALFSYIALLNLGIFAMCWFKAWRSLNLTGFVFTFFISALWAASRYQPEFYLSCQFFLILFATLYTGINTLYCLKQDEGAKGAVDALMTFGTPALYSLLQWKLVAPFEYGSALSAASFGAAYIVLARSLFAQCGEKVRFLVESYLTIGLVLLTLAVPFTFDGRASSAIWALEAAALIWNGIRQQRFLTRVLGIILLPLSSFLFLSDTTTGGADIGFLNQYFMGIALLTAGHLISATLLLHAPDEVVKSEEKQFGYVALVLAAAWWCFGGTFEVSRHLDGWRRWCSDLFADPLVISRVSFDTSIYSLFTSLSMLGSAVLLDRLKLPGKKLLDPTLILVHLWLLLLASIGPLAEPPRHVTHILAIAGVVAWPLFFMVHYWMLHAADYKGEDSINRSEHGPLSPWLHTASLWMFIYITTHEVCLLAETYATTGWRDAALVFVPALCALMISSSVKKAARWPYTSHAALYCSALALPVCWAMALSFLFDFISESTAPQPYIPLLNALDVAQAAAVIALLTWTTQISRFGKFSETQRSMTYSILGVWSFVWATSTLLRIIHHTTGIPWNFVSMFDSTLVQAALSLFWSVAALSLMLLSHRKAWRQLWKIGACLIGAVVVKLFLVDLANNGTVGRIAAFLGVGVLMLGIGYLVPIPPAKEAEGKE